MHLGVDTKSMENMMAKQPDSRPDSPPTGFLSRFIGSKPSRKLPVVDTRQMAKAFTEMQNDPMVQARSRLLRDPEAERFRIAQECLEILKTPEIQGIETLLRAAGQTDEKQAILQRKKHPSEAGIHDVAAVLKGFFADSQALNIPALRQTFLTDNGVCKKETQNDFIEQLKKLCDAGDEKAKFIRDTLVVCQQICEKNKDRGVTEPFLKYETFALGFSNLAIGLGFPAGSEKDLAKMDAVVQENGKWLVTLLKSDKFKEAFVSTPDASQQNKTAIRLS